MTFILLLKAGYFGQSVKKTDRMADPSDAPFSRHSLRQKLRDPLCAARQGSIPGCERLPFAIVSFSVSMRTAAGERHV